MPRHVFEISQETVENAEWWSSILGTIALSVFLGARNYLTPWEKLLLGIFGFSEAVYVAKAAYDLSCIQWEESSDPYTKKLYKKKMHAALVKLALSVIKASLVITAVIGGTLIGAASMIVAGPILFLTVTCISFTENIGATAHHLYKKRPREAAKSLALAAIDALVGSAIVLAVMAAPISVPAIAIAASAILGGLVLFRIGCAIYNRYHEQKTDLAEIHESESLSSEASSDSTEVLISRSPSNDHAEIIDDKAKSSTSSNKESLPTGKKAVYTNLSLPNISRYFRCTFFSRSGSPKKKSLDKTPTSQPIMESSHSIA